MVPIAILFVCSVGHLDGGALLFLPQKKKKLSGRFGLWKKLPLICFNKQTENMNISKLHNLAELLLANANTAKQCAEWMADFCSESAAFGRNLTEGIIDVEVHEQQVMREAIRAYQRLESLAEYWGVDV